MLEGTIARPPREIVEGFRAIPTATISDVLDSMKLSGIVNGFRCLIPDVRIAGYAFTVKSIAGERDTYTAADFPIGQVIAKMERDDIFTVDLGGREVRLVQETDYPWDGRVRIAVRTAEPADFTLALRIPGWCRGARAWLNGRPLDLKRIARRGCAHLRRERRRIWTAPLAEVARHLLGIRGGKRGAIATARR